LGQAKLGEIRQVGSSAERAYLKPLSAAERKQLHALLSRLVGGKYR
jgi:predicted RNA-binding protein Jag